MADNLTVTPGSGATIATDEIGGVMYQRVKIGIGPDGVATDLAFGQAAKAASLPVTIASDQGALAVDPVSAAYNVKASLSRPANTDAYAVNDVVCGAFTFNNIGPSGGSTIFLTGAQLQIDIGSVPSGMAGFRLFLYSATPTSALADNAPFDLAVADRAAFLGSIDIDTPVAYTSTLYIENLLNKQMKLASANLFAYLVTLGAYTPNSGTTYNLTLHTITV